MIRRPPKPPIRRTRKRKAGVLFISARNILKPGDIDKAEKILRRALRISRIIIWHSPEKDRARAAQNDFENADKVFKRLAQKVPLTETVIVFGDIYQKTGQNGKSQPAIELAEVIEQKIGE